MQQLDRFGIVGKERGDPFLHLIRQRLSQLRQFGLVANERNVVPFLFILAELLERLRVDVGGVGAVRIRVPLVEFFERGGVAGRADLVQLSGDLFLDRLQPVVLHHAKGDNDAENRQEDEQHPHRDQQNRP